MLHSPDDTVGRTSDAPDDYVNELTLAELRALPLLDTSERVHTLAEHLAFVERTALYANVDLKQVFLSVSNGRSVGRVEKCVEKCAENGKVCGKL